MEREGGDGWVGVGSRGEDRERERISLQTLLVSARPTVKVRPLLGGASSEPHIMRIISV